MVTCVPGPAYPTFATAFTNVLAQAQMSQSALAEHLRQRGVKADQSLVAKWCNGHKAPAQITHYPIIEEICAVPRGTIFKLAGYVADVDSTPEAAIAADPRLTPRYRRDALSFLSYCLSQSAQTVAQ